jgi:uncharacterized protein YbcC (UPF0753/DUF2309 family)
VHGSRHTLPTTGAPETLVREIVEHIAHLLPAQGPIRIFIHHNTLHAFEDIPFEEAVVTAGERFGCRPFLSEEEFRRELATGRIRIEDLHAVLEEELGERGNELVAPGLTRFDFRLSLLEHGLHEPEEEEIEWHLNEAARLDRSLWAASLAAASALVRRLPPAPPKVRHRDLLLDATGEDTDSLLHPLLIRLCAAFVDQGIASWRMPGRERGLFRCFVELYGRGRMPDAWLRGLAERLRAPREQETPPASSIVESLARLGVPQEEWKPFLQQTLLVFRGWPGMIRQIEERPDRVLAPTPPGSLVDFLAVRLILEELAVERVARTALGHRGPLSAVRELARSRVSAREPSPRLPGYLLYQTAFRLRWDPSRIEDGVAAAILAETEAFPDLERRRVFHLAYERRIRNQTLDALAASAPGSPRPVRVSFQTIHCIDEREESIRRHLEEVDPECETFGAPGFFGVAMYYRGAHDAHPVPLCPIVIRPRHEVVEEAVGGIPEIGGFFRRLAGRAAHALHVGSRTGILGSILTGVFGTLATLPLALRVVFPRLAHKVRSGMGTLVSSSNTRLNLDAFSTEERSDIVRRLLEEIGLTSGFAPIVAVVGHGSSSLNNPHESAHDCGACGGGRGGPNARAFAAMANDPRVRERLGITRGWTIPADTVFLGASHNSCNDAVEWYDLDLVPASHADDLRAAMAALDEARARNAHERCRRFNNAPLDIGPEGALRHVQARTEDLAQVRPEYGHATNAAALIGRRKLTRGLFMDRRTFLASYDPERDPDGSILRRILQAVVPVCAGISLEYYFSFVDPSGYGCATKLPHNISGLLGVMDGHASDLRTGLPWQMVEIHEPVRLLVAIEARRDRILSVLSQLPVVDRLIRNRWIQLASLDPETGEIHVFERAAFRPYAPGSGPLPDAPSSADWYSGRRGHLGYARVRR